MTSHYEDDAAAAASLARFARENDTLRRSTRKHYEGQRRLENAIRRHAQGLCNCKTDTACLLALARLVPKTARPAYKSRNLKKVRTP